MEDRFAQRRQELLDSASVPVHSVILHLRFCDVSLAGMSEPKKPTCAACVAKDAEIARLTAQLAAARKNSTNSSKPPSSDIVKPDQRPAVPEGQAKRTIGAQPGHPAHVREFVDDLQVNEVVPHTRSGYPHCAGQRRRNGDLVHRFQQVDIVLPSRIVTEHPCPDSWCSTCGKSCRADRPEAVRRGGLVGPMLTTLVADRKGCCHASFSTIRFGVIHRREPMSAAALRRELDSAKASILAVAQQAPATPQAHVLAKRFVVLDRHVTQGTRGEKGRRWCERIWTVLATCRQREISPFAFLREAIANWLDGTESPSLMDGAFAPA